MQVLAHTHAALHLLLGFNSFCPSTGNTISAERILFLGSSVLSAENPPWLTAPRPPRSGHLPAHPRPRPAREHLLSPAALPLPPLCTRVSGFTLCLGSHLYVAFRKVLNYVL